MPPSASTGSRTRPSSSTSRVTRTGTSGSTRRQWRSIRTAAGPTSTDVPRPLRWTQSPASARIFSSCAAASASRPSSCSTNRRSSARTKRSPAPTRNSPATSASYRPCSSATTSHATPSRPTEEPMGHCCCAERRRSPRPRPTFLPMRRRPCRLPAWGTGCANG